MTMMRPAAGLGVVAGVRGTRVGGVWRRAVGSGGPRVW